MSSKTQIRMATGSSPQDSLNGAGSSIPKLTKKDSDLNLLPPEQQKLQQQSDETVFEREKRMAVLLAPSTETKHAQLVFIDVDFQSTSYCKILARIVLPNFGDEPFAMSCMRNAMSSTKLFAAYLNNNDPTQDSPDSLRFANNNSFTLVIPVPNNFCIYVISVLLLEGISEFPMQLRIQKILGVMVSFQYSNFIDSNIQCQTDFGAPLAVVSNNAGRHQTGYPLLICACSDKNNHTKGDLIRLDRRTYALVGHKRFDDDSNSYSSAMCNSSPESSPLGCHNKLPQYGGAIAIHLRQGVIFSTEWGNLAEILGPNPKIYDDILEDDENNVYGHAVNIWDLNRRTLRQRLLLNPTDGRWTICIRMLHHSELTHGFVCSAIGSSIFHIHKSSLILLENCVKLEKWADSSEVPAFCTDMVISMDDCFLYVCAAFHGFIAQFQITDPFRPSLTQKIFLGGIICEKMSILPDECHRNTEISHRIFNSQKKVIGNRKYEGGLVHRVVLCVSGDDECDILSLDGRRLFVSNSFLRNWDAKFFPQIVRKGSSIVIIHVDKDGHMELDEKFSINFDSPEETNPKDPNSKRSAEDMQAFCIREMRFLSGDSTSDSTSDFTI